MLLTGAHIKSVADVGGGEKGGAARADCIDTAVVDSKWPTEPAERRWAKHANGGKRGRSLSLSLAHHFSSASPPSTLFLPSLYPHKTLVVEIFEGEKNSNVKPDQCGFISEADIRIEREI